MSRVSTLLLVLTSWLVLIPSAAVAAIPTPSDDITAVDEPNVPSSQFVRRAILTTAIDAREPVDNYNAKEIPSDTKKLYFFTEMVNKADEYVTHRWFLNGKLVAEIVLDIGSDRWRTYSSKNLMPSLRGTWEVEVVDQQNRLLATTSFTY
ncbi:DUF2914 domain-containing protein [Psychrosphaera ytuae]|uniref:DUF2914 domain-containing protein n=1 Tax=Psychrosphaera ytuae TaxID=2820710 RepID=A0A975D900_9GAMM|nr:DUF2914 domain-containing protein [Psychrosphaera ytuae]QTH62736.1 DUF2914 domain-containing protein [Psychrosphaera ytuae]